MMAKARLLRVERGRTETAGQEGPFFRRCCLAVLLALKEEGALTEEQLRQAETALEEERHGSGERGV